MRSVFRGLAKTATLLGLGLVVPAIAFGAPRHKPPETPPMVVRIGALLDQSSASTSPDFQHAVALAGEQMNKALARAHAPLRFDILYGNTKSDPGQTLVEAKRLLGAEHVQALVSDSSIDTVKVNGLNYDLASTLPKVPVTCFQCSSSFFHDPTVTDPDPVTQAAERDADHWLFRVFYNARFEAAVITRLAIEKAGANKPGFAGRLLIGVFADPGHRSLAEAIPKVLPQLYSGPAKVAIHYVSSSEKIGPDWAAVVNSAEGTPNVLIVAMLPGNVTEAIRSYRAAGYKLPIVANNSFRRDFILKQIGPGANGLEGSSVMVADRSRNGSDFLRAFHAATGHRPEVTASGAYDSAATLMLAAVVASKAGTVAHPLTGADIRRGLTEINAKGGRAILPTVSGFTLAAKLGREGKPIDYHGAYDASGWDANGELYPPLVRWVVEHDRFVEREAYACTLQQPLCPPLAPVHKTARHAKKTKMEKN
jgi:ABC-type branched-subunit amino acid transport system substrate-binding protein